MSTPEEADAWFAKHGVADLTRVSDPSHHLYREFGLGDGSIFALAHPRVGGRWFRSALRYGAGWQGSHWRQLTGVFVVQRGAILAEIRHRNSAARPDYLALVERANAGATIR